MGMATVLGVIKWKLKINGWYVDCSNVDALNGGYISRSEEGLPLMDLSYCFYCKKEKRKKKKG